MPWFGIGNNLPDGHIGFGFTTTTVHLHGAHLMPRADGFPDNIVNRPADFPVRVAGFFLVFDRCIPRKVIAGLAGRREESRGRCE